MIICSWSWVSDQTVSTSTLPLQSAFYENPTFYSDDYTSDIWPGPPGHNEWPIVLASLHLFHLIHSFVVVLMQIIQIAVQQMVDIKSKSRICLEQHNRLWFLLLKLRAAIGQGREPRLHISPHHTPSCFADGRNSDMARQRTWGPELPVSSLTAHGPFLARCLVYTLSSSNMIQFI